MRVRIVNQYDLPEEVRLFLEELYQSAQTVVVTSERRPRLVVVPYERYRLLAERLAHVGQALQEMGQTIEEAEGDHPYHDLKEGLIADGVLDAQ